MNGLLGCFLTLLIVILLSVLMPLLKIGSMVFKFRRGMRQAQRTTQQGPRHTQRESTTRSSKAHDKPAQQQKIYAPGEGEYVDFEEVSDDGPKG